eukprot:8870109-Pyramimonas_sp.AAC.1
MAPLTWRARALCASWRPAGSDAGSLVVSCVYICATSCLRWAHNETVRVNRGRWGLRCTSSVYFRMRTKGVIWEGSPGGATGDPYRVNSGQYNKRSYIQ